MRIVLCLLLATLSIGRTFAGPLADDLGRNETRVFSATYPLRPGRTVSEMALPERLDRLGYRRVHERPDAPGEYFWGHERFWIYGNDHRWAGRDREARLFALKLRRKDGMVLGGLSADGDEIRLDDSRGAWLEPELIAESLDNDRAQRLLIDLGDLPDLIWRPVLAAEDARFFDHSGVDARSLARAALANAQSGGVVQGGSTITQQLVKNRDLSAKRTLGRKASEAVRALALEAQYDKREILEAYLNLVYLGHVEGVAIYGFGTAAQVFFRKRPSQLTLSEAALLAAMIQGPNRLSPLRNPERARERRDWVLGRMGELGWANVADVARARRTPIDLNMEPPDRPPAGQFLGRLAAEVSQRFPERVDGGRGLVIESTLDMVLQRAAESAVARRLEQLEHEAPGLRGAGLTAALVALDARSGAILAYVGGDPRDVADDFDRVRGARRQPGSVVKPLVLLEAFESCGGRPLNAATRVADEPLRIELPAGPWEPSNYDDRFHGIVDVRTAIRNSYNIPFVRISRWCGSDRTAARMRKSGLELPLDPPPSFVLGAVETTPLTLAAAFTVFATPGKSWTAFGASRFEKPAGSALLKVKPRQRSVVHASTAYIVRDLLRDSVEHGTGHNAAIDGRNVAGKTGTSSGLRDAWFVGHAEGLVTAVWIGIARERRLGLTGGSAAAPLWRDFMRVAVPARPPFESARPGSVETHRVDPETGLLIPDDSSRGREELFRRRALPRRNRFWRVDEGEPIVR